MPSTSVSGFLDGLVSTMSNSLRFLAAYQENSVAWMFGGKDVVLDGEGTGTLFGNGQVRLHGALPDEIYVLMHLPSLNRPSTMHEYVFPQQPEMESGLNGPIFIDCQ